MMSLFKKLFGKQNVNEITTNCNSLEYLKTKFFRNLNLLVEYDLAIDCYCDIAESWNDKPLNSNETYLEIHPKIKQKLDLEFSEELCDKMKNGNVHFNEVENLIAKLDSDYLLYKGQYDYTKASEGEFLEKFQNGTL